MSPVSSATLLKILCNTETSQGGSFDGFWKTFKAGSYSRIDLGLGFSSSGTQGPKFNPQYHKKKKKSVLSVHKQEVRGSALQREKM